MIDPLISFAASLARRNSRRELNHSFSVVGGAKKIPLVGVHRTFSSCVYLRKGNRPTVKGRNIPISKLAVKNSLLLETAEAKRKSES